MSTPMAKPLSREDRLGAKLRENLRRRKAQARALAAGETLADADAAQNESGALSNEAPES